MASFVVPGVPLAAALASRQRGLGDNLAPDILAGLDFGQVYFAAAAPFLIGGAVLLIALSSRR